MVVHPHCRFCRTELSVEIPEGEENAKMAKLIGNLVSRVCCNRCADYHRGQRDRADRIQRASLAIKTSGDREANALRQMVTTVATSVVQAAEDHYLISGLLSEAKEFAKTILEQPEYAASHVRVFDKKANELAMRTHNREPEYPY
jgi:hypothetical protein